MSTLSYGNYSCYGSIESAVMTIIRTYRAADQSSVEAFWIDINREIAPPHMKALFERYIRNSVLPELYAINEIFSIEKRSIFWVVLDPNLVGTLGIQNQDDETCELRRMYVEKTRRRTGLAAFMLDFAEAQARRLNYTEMVLSTADIQQAAMRFYVKTGYTYVGSEVAYTPSTTRAGGGLTRHHYRKRLNTTT